MKRKKIQEQVEKRIDKYDYGYAFTPKDFIDIADSKKISVVLIRIKETGKIRRILQGIYYKPKYSNLLKEYSSPDPNNIVDALKRKYNWSVIPSGNTALNILHLTTQVPNVWNYASSGPKRKYTFNNITINFIPIKQREITGLSEITTLIIQAIRTLGSENITKKNIQLIRNQLNVKDKKIILEESKNSSAWIYEIIKKICEE